MTFPDLAVRPETYPLVGAATGDYPLGPLSVVGAAQPLPMLVGASVISNDVGVDDGTFDGGTFSSSLFDGSGTMD